VNQTLQVSIKTPYSDLITYTSDYIVQKANKPKQTKDVLYNQFDKLGDTPFFLQDFTVDTDDISFIPNKILNDLRRRVLDKLIYSLTSNISPKISRPSTDEIQVTNSKEITLKVETQEQLEIVLHYPVDHILISEHLQYIGDDKRVKVLSNRIWHSKKDYVARDYGQLPSDYIDSSFNVTNSLSVYELHKQGVKTIPLSQELDENQIKKILRGYKARFGHNPNLEFVIYNRPELMLLKYCPISKGLDINKQNCNICMKHTYSLRNQDQSYPLLRDSGCTMKLLHHQPINKIKDIGTYQSFGIQNFRLDFTSESKDDVNKVLKYLYDKL
jgi:putative protease